MSRLESTSSFRPSTPPVRPLGSPVDLSGGVTPPAATRAQTRRDVGVDAFEHAPAQARSTGVSATLLGTTAAATGPGKRSMTFVYDAGPHTQLTNLQLRGSWDASGNYSNSWGPGSIPMTPLGDGKWAATVELMDDGQPRDWQWGVVADGPTGKGQWAMMGESNARFSLEPGRTQVSYAPTTYHQMGAQRSGEDASFRFWAPNARNVTVKVTSPEGQVQRFAMEREADGTWAGKAKGAWAALEGQSYVYEVTGSDGIVNERPDPYARDMMGEQRGVGRLYMDPATGREVNRYTPNRQELMRFEVDEAENAAAAYLILKDASGRPLTRDELLARLGTFDASKVDQLRAGRGNDLWSQNVEADGRIRMTQLAGAWSTLVNNPEKLAGLRYEMQVWDKTETGGLRLRGDGDGDGKLSDVERRGSHYNDKWSDVISQGSGITFRGSLITSPNNYVWKNDNVPREKDPSKWVVYQAHVGSFLGQGQNVNRSTFEDMIGKLDHFKKLGVNTIELLPTNEVEGNRDWGYLGVNSLAAESAYGFVDTDGRWVSGSEALKRFIDEAHGRGLNVISDVVYNHVFGDYSGMWNVDGPENPYFNWNRGQGAPEIRNTPWGAVPAYHQQKVRQFFVDHAVQQVQELHFDGLRFDFTEPIKGTGGKEGWELLREINRQVHFYKPGTWTVAEQFDYDPSITRPSTPDGSGGGFDAQWYSEFQHLLVADHGGREGLIQSAARGRRTNMDAFMDMLVKPRGLDGWRTGLTMISNHDEVGNEMRTQNQAEGDRPTDFPDQWSRNAARFAAGIGLTSPGIPMFFQGDESLAQNDFRWGNPSTWDVGWQWENLGKDWDWDALKMNDGQRAVYERLLALPPQQRAQDGAYRGLSAADRKVVDDLSVLKPDEQRQAMMDINRRQTVRFYQDAIALRASSPAFRADSEVQRVYTHNDNSVMAYSRKSGNDEYIVVSSLNRQDFSGYGMALPPGNWKEVFNSDATMYGGSGFGNAGGTLSGGPDARVNIPAAGYVVLKRV